ncbi:MAG TPA: MFS transporter [Telluria sp.]
MKFEDSLTQAPLTEAAPPPAAAIPSMAILWLSLAAFCTSMSARVTDAQLPHLAAEFGVSLGGASYIITCFAIAFGASQLLLGSLGDRYGKYLAVGWACAASAITTALCGLAPGFSLLLAARLLAGATVATIIPFSMAWIGDVVPYERRQPVLARFLLGQIVGLSAGVMLGGLAVDHLGWRVPFFGIAVAFAALSIALLSMNRRLPARARQVHKSEGSAVRRTLTGFGQLLTLQWPRIVLLTVFAEGACVYGALAFIASHLHSTHGLSLSVAGSLLMLFGLGGVLYATFSGRLVRGLGEAGLARWGGAFLGGGLLAAAVAPSWQWAIPGCFFSGLGFYMLHNTLQINATQMAPERRGAAVSAFSACFLLGQSAGIALAGLLMEQIGTATVIAVGAAGALVVGINFGRLRARKPAAVCG